MSHRALRLVLLSGLIGSCIDPLDTPTCAPIQVTTTGMSGDTVLINTGLKYIETVAGTEASVTSCKSVAILYDAYLLDGTKFDSTGSSSPFIFAPGFGQLIDGLEQGVVGMKYQGRRRLIIPPQLGFGSEARRNEEGEIVVPANSTVVYDVEVISVAQ